MKWPLLTFLKIKVSWLSAFSTEMIKWNKHADWKVKSDLKPTETIGSA